MTVAELVEVLAQRGVSIRADGHDLVLKPARLLPAELVPALRAHKVELLDRLRLPKGWPADVPTPPWWGELAGPFPPGFFQGAKQAECLDPACRFPVAVLWPGHGQDGPTWSCPKCGLRTGCLPPGSAKSPDPAFRCASPDHKALDLAGQSDLGKSLTNGVKHQESREADPAEVCWCGSTEYRDVWIHNGQSIRRDCAKCGRFLRFVVWHGRNQNARPCKITSAAAVGSVLGWIAADLPAIMAEDRQQAGRYVGRLLYIAARR